MRKTREAHCRSWPALGLSYPAMVLSRTYTRGPILAELFSANSLRSRRCGGSRGSCRSCRRGGSAGRGGGAGRGRWLRRSVIDSNRRACRNRAPHWRIWSGSRHPPLPQDRAQVINENSGLCPVRRRRLGGLGTYSEVFGSRRQNSRFPHWVL